MAKKKVEEPKGIERERIDDIQEFMTEIGYAQCNTCEDYIKEPRNCNVCGYDFCNDCADDHAFEETGL